MNMRWLAKCVALCVIGWWAQPASAVCTDQRMMDPIRDIVWDCIFPIEIAGIPLDFGEHPPDTNHAGMFCECEGKGIYGFGFLVSFWEPARMVDTVADPWCFPALGMKFDVGTTGSGYTGGG